MKLRIPHISDSLRGHLLIATPTLSQGFFSRTVTYICEHGESGAMGIVINQPLKIKLNELLEHLNIEVTQQSCNDIVFAGGPIQTDHGFVLHRSAGEWENSLKVSEQTYLTTSQDILTAIASGSGPKEHLIAMGYAGWSAGQLEKELAESSWLTVETGPNILFNTTYDERLTTAGWKLGINIHLMSSDVGHA